MLSGTPWGEERTGSQAGLFSPAVESYVDKDGKTYHCRVSLPGIDSKDVQIQAQGNQLTTSGERKGSRTGKDVDYMHKEIWYGSFERTLSLPDGVEADKIKAEYNSGVLEITAPIAASALPRRIEIKTTPMSKQVSA
jgi:HSP20 family protein